MMLLRWRLFHLTIFTGCSWQKQALRLLTISAFNALNELLINWRFIKKSR